MADQGSIVSALPEAKDTGKIDAWAEFGGQVAGLAMACLAYWLLHLDAHALQEGGVLAAIGLALVVLAHFGRRMGLWRRIEAAARGLGYWALMVAAVVLARHYLPPPLQQGMATVWNWLVLALVASVLVLLVRRLLRGSMLLNRGRRDLSMGDP